MAKFPIHRAVAAWAAAEQEKGVAEIPLGSNTGSRVRFYQRHTWLGGTGWPWCAAFVAAAWEEAGQKLPWPTAGAYDMGNRARKSGWRVTSPSQLIPGDIVVWNTGAGHVSLFLRYDRRNGLIYTVDGNVSNRVDYRARRVGLARDLIHVPERPTKTPVEKPGVFEVVTADDGQKVIYVSGARAIGRNLARFLRNNPAGVVVRRKK